eukprot:3548268-Prymnesium_polylepis.1
MYDAMRATGWGAIMYKIMMFIVGRYVLLNMYLAVILACFAMIRSSTQQQHATPKLIRVKEELKEETAKCKLKCAIARVAALQQPEAEQLKTTPLGQMPGDQRSSNRLCRRMSSLCTRVPEGIARSISTRGSVASLLVDRSKSVVAALVPALPEEGDELGERSTGDNSHLAGESEQTRLAFEREREKALKKDKEERRRQKKMQQSVRISTVA